MAKIKFVIQKFGNHLYYWGQSNENIERNLCNENHIEGDKKVKSTLNNLIKTERNQANWFELSPKDWECMKKFNVSGANNGHLHGKWKYIEKRKDEVSVRPWHKYE